MGRYEQNITFTILEGISTIRQLASRRVGLRTISQQYGSVRRCISFHRRYQNIVVLEGVSTIHEVRFSLCFFVLDCPLCFFALNYF